MTKGTGVTKKNLNYYIDLFLTNILKTANIATDNENTLDKISVVSLTHAGFSHMFCNHILATLCENVKQTIAGWKDADCQDIWKHMFCHTIIKENPYRKAGNPTVTLDMSSAKTKVSLKSVNVYRSAFHLAICGQVLGVDSSMLSILQRTITWFGKYHCANLNEELLELLTAECHSICSTIECHEILGPAFAKKQNLRVWRNLVNICLYDTLNIEQMNELPGEREHKFVKSHISAQQNYRKESLCIQATTTNRLLKDIGYALNGREINGQKNILGSAIKADYTNRYIFGNKDARIHLGAITSHLAETKECETELNNDDFDKDFYNIWIQTLAVNPYPKEDWKSIQKHEAKDNRVIYQLRRKRLHVVIKALKNFVQNIYTIDESFNNWQDGWFELLSLLVDGESNCGRLRGAASCYLSWEDSIFVPGQVWWGYDGDYFLQTTEILFRLRGLHKATKICEIIERNDLDICRWGLHDIVFSAGFDWETVSSSDTLNYHLYDLHNTPLIRVSGQYTVRALCWGIQQVHIEHDHQIPDQLDMAAMYDKLPSLKVNCIKKVSDNLADLEDIEITLQALHDAQGIEVTDTEMKNNSDYYHCDRWQKLRIKSNDNNIEHDNDVAISDIATYCGLLWLCKGPTHTNTTHVHPKARLNCQQCQMLPVHVRNSVYIQSCTHSKHQIFRAYAIKQGFCPRWYTTRKISMLTSKIPLISRMAWYSLYD